jgi:hypothetical protein
VRGGAHHQRRPGGGPARPHLWLITVLGLVAACQAEPTTELQSWWGPLDSEGGDTQFGSGGQLQVTGFAHRFAVDEGDDDDSAGGERELVQVVLIEGVEPIDCASYSGYLEQTRQLQGVVDAAIPDLYGRELEASELASFVCDEVGRATRDAFGGAGVYRALHLLADVSDGGPQDGLFRAAPPGEEPPEVLGAELLIPSTVVQRLYERSSRGDGLVPAGGEGGWEADDLDPLNACPSIAMSLLTEIGEEVTTYPDRASLALQAATYRYYHHYSGQESIQLGTGTDLAVGLQVPDWKDAGTVSIDGTVTVFVSVTRAPETFPYQQMLLSTEAQPVTLGACPELAETATLVWPELLGGDVAVGTELSGETCADGDPTGLHPECWQAGCSAGGQGPPRPSSLLALLFATIAVTFRRRRAR